MQGGVKTAILLSGVALAGCSAANDGVKVRPIANPSAMFSKGDALAVARGQFMLGNIGLALEGFRKAQRDNPSDPAVLAGIGDCYAAMGRFDIAESSYEVALSLAPRDHALLLGLASVLERGGDLKRAADIRAEAARFQQTEALLAAQARSRALIAARAAGEARQLAVDSSSVTVALPAPRPVTQHSSGPAPSTKVASAVGPATTPARPPIGVARALPAEAPRRPPAADRLAVLAKLAASNPPVVVPAVAVQREIERPATAERSPAPVVVKRAAYAEAADIPVANTAIPAEVSIQAYLNARASAPVLAPGMSLASVAPIEPPVPAVAPAPLAPPIPPKSSHAVALALTRAEPMGPRLERLSQGEVALVTTGNASWRSASPVRKAKLKSSAVQVASADDVRWVPLRLAGARPGVQVLNAARSQGLAASARGVLFGRGWRAVGIGNATAARATSVVFYPADRAALGRRLAAQFGVPAKLSEHSNVVLVLGRDSIDRIAGQRRS
jgi:hypothetical protein